MSRAYVDFHFAPNWELIDPAREFLQKFFTITLANDEFAGLVGLAAHELMENAIKYSPNDEARVRVEIDSGQSVLIAVENDSLPEHVESLLAEVNALQSAADPAAYYQQKMLESYERTDGKSCLGLSRIRVEAGMQLKCEIIGARVRMTATRELPVEAPIVTNTDKPATASP